MNTQTKQLSPESHVQLLATQPAPYEAPAIEVVVTREELEREVHYAGFVGGSGALA